MSDSQTTHIDNFFITCGQLNPFAVVLAIKVVGLMLILVLGAFGVFGDG